MDEEIMTHKKIQHTHDQHNTNDDIIEKHDTNPSTGTGDDKKQWDDTIAILAKLEKDITDQKEISKRAQYDYINLKMDFDRWQRLKTEEAKTAHIDTLIAAVQKLLPFVEDLRKSLATIPDDQHDNPLAKWVQMTYNKFVQTLASMHIKQIESIGLLPDGYLHEPVSTQPVDDEAMKGRIITEFEKGFLYDDGQTKKVITPSKVVIGQ